MCCASLRKHRGALKDLRGWVLLHRPTGAWLPECSCKETGANVLGVGKAYTRETKVVQPKCLMEAAAHQSFGMATQGRSAKPVFAFRFPLALKQGQAFFVEL